MSLDETAQLIAAHTIDVPDFPKPGVVFKDLSPLFSDGRAFRRVIDAIVGAYAGRFDVVAGIEARGFLLAAAVGYAATVGVVPIRKAGKLPRATLSASYELEYGSATIEVQQDAFLGGQAGGEVVGFVALLELSFLHGRDRLSGFDVTALLTV